MASPRVPQRTGSAGPAFAKRTITALVVVVVALFALKLVAGFVIGLFTTALTLVAIVAVLGAGLWAYRRL